VANHDEIIELLPDYAVAALDDGDLWRVAAHVDSCPICQRELSSLLEMVVLLMAAPAPPQSVKRAVLQRAGMEPMVSAVPSALRAVPPASERRREPSAAPLPSPEVSMPSPPERLRRPRPWQFHPAQLALVAALLLVIAGFSVWSLLTDGEGDEGEAIAALLLDPDAAHPIDDSELDVGAGGVMFTDPGNNIAYLVAHGLPVPGPDQRYQVWLFTEDGRRVDAGPIDVTDDGVAQAVVRAPADFSEYWAVGVSLEPTDRSLTPTSPLVVGGWLR